MTSPDAPPSSKIARDYVQIGTLVAVLGGGYAGKDAYDEVAQRLHEATVQAARTEQVLENLGERLKDHSARPHDAAIELNASTTARIREIEVRMAACPCAGRPIPRATPAAVHDH